MDLRRTLHQSERRTDGVGVRHQPDRLAWRVGRARISACLRPATCRRRRTPSAGGLAIHFALHVLFLVLRLKRITAGRPSGSCCGAWSRKWYWDRSRPCGESARTNGARSRDSSGTGWQPGTTGSAIAQYVGIVDLSHLSSGIFTASIFGGAGSPFFSSLRVFLHSALVQPKNLPKRPVLSCISLPHLSHSRLGPRTP